MSIFSDRKPVFLATASLLSMVLGIASPAVAQTTGSQSDTTPTDVATDTQGAAGQQQSNGQTEATAASSDEQTARDIVVTGSRLKRTAADIDQPAQILDSEQITKRGYTNLGTALQELPAFSVPANSPIGAQGSFSAGQTFVNLYNLGAQRTLSLVNGHRFVSSSTSSIFGPVAGSPVDLTDIPTTLVDRIETISVGGAPIYGSDAIAGTVNVILKNNIEGLHLQVQNGIAQRGDGGEHEIALTAGKNFADGRGNVTLSVQYNHQAGIPTSDRYWTGADRPFFGSATPGHSYTNELFYGGQHYNVFTNTGMPLLIDSYPILGDQPYASVTNSQGQALYFDNSGHLAVFHNGIPTGDSISQAGGDGFRIADYGNFLSETNRVQATALAHYDFSDSTHLSVEGWYGRSSARNLRDQPFYNTYLFADAGDVNGDLILNTDNPFLSEQDRATIVSNLTENGLDPSTFYLARANTDLATGGFKTTNELYRFVGDLTGDFYLGDHKLTWDFNGTYGHVHTRTKTREIVNQNFYNALDAVRDGSGNIVCRPGYANATIATLNSTCEPLDVFGVNQASQASLDYISALATPTQNNEQYDLVASVGGSIITLPAGDVQALIGYEHRHESTAFDPGTFYYGEPNGDGTRTQYGNSIPIDPVSGAFHTNEAFGELQIPLISNGMNVPLVYSLNFEGSARYAKNSLTSGGFWSYTAGGNYAPIQGLAFRGNYTRSFRAPAISEVFAPNGQVFDTADDPCDSRFISGGPNPSQRAANCAAEGIPTDFQSNIADYTAKGTFSGNRNLENEIANSWTAGATLQPDFLPHFSLTADYISIDIKNEIASLGVGDLLNACYDSSDYPDNPFCSTFTRDADHQVVSFQEGNYNAAIERFRALQATANLSVPLSTYGLPESAGTLGLGVNYLHTFKHFYKVGTGDKTYTVGTSSEPTDNFTANFNYDNGGFNVLWQVQYYGKSRIDVNTPITNYQYPTVDAYFMYNTSVGYRIDDKYSIRLVVDNVLDKHPPFPYSGLSTTRYYDAIMGRYFHINIGVDF
ncbi:TonB-dependent receptor [Sphingomonas koreensis]|nr:TonB-dependent receptor [Sphingomonas koreensis]